MSIWPVLWSIICISLYLARVSLSVKQWSILSLCSFDLNCSKSRANWHANYINLTSFISSSSDVYLLNHLVTKESDYSTWLLIWINSGMLDAIKLLWFQLSAVCWSYMLMPIYAMLGSLRCDVKMFIIVLLNSPVDGIIYRPFNDSKSGLKWDGSADSCSGKYLITEERYASWAALTAGTKWIVFYEFDSYSL